MEMKGGTVGPVTRARRARTIRMCPLDARNRRQTPPSLGRGRKVLARRALNEACFVARISSRDASRLRAGLSAEGFGPQAEALPPSRGFRRTGQRAGTNDAFNGTLV